MKGVWMNPRSVMTALKNPTGKESIGFVSMLLCRRQSPVTFACGPQRAYHKQCMPTNATTQLWMKQQRHCSALRYSDSLPAFNLLQSIPSRSICTSPSRLNAGESNGSLSEVAGGTIGQIKPKLALKYKCNICDHENYHTFAKETYESGVVVVQCQSCNSHHLVADNLGWFPEKDRRKSIKGMLESKVKAGEYSFRSSKQEDGTIEVEVSTDRRID